MAYLILSSSSKHSIHDHTLTCSKTIREEALGPIEEDIKRLVRDQHREFFDERKQSIVTVSLWYSRELIVNDIIVSVFSTFSDATANQ